MEAEVSNVEGIQTSARPLKDDNAVKLNFISSNGPHPLMSTKVVEEMLTRHFGEDGHFTLVDRDGTSQRWWVAISNLPRIPQTRWDDVIDEP